MHETAIIDLTSLSDTDHDSSTGHATDGAISMRQEYTPRQIVQLPACSTVSPSSSPAPIPTEKRVGGSRTLQKTQIALSPVESELPVKDCPRANVLSTTDLPTYLASWSEDTKDEARWRRKSRDTSREDSTAASNVKQKSGTVRGSKSGVVGTGSLRSKKQAHGVAYVRGSNLVDDLLMSGNSDDDSVVTTVTNHHRMLPTAQAAASKYQIFQRGEVPPQYQTGPPDSTDVLYSLDRPSKRKRVATLLRKPEISETATATTGTPGTKKTSLPESSSTKPLRRRGRPPGSRNKNKLGWEQQYLSPLPKQQSFGTAVAGQVIPSLPRPYNSKQSLSKASILRHRELGGCPGLNSRNLQKKLRQNVLERGLSKWKAWAGASKDIITAAWSPGGTNFAVGASTDLDALNLRYNRNNNLLWGDTEQVELTELPDHHLPRCTFPNIDSNEEAGHASAILDPHVFTTVSTICFNESGSQMYTGSYDRSVKIWDAAKGKKRPKCVATINHTARVELLSERMTPHSCILATAQRDIDHPVSVVEIKADDPGCAQFTAKLTSERAQKMGLLPTALRWGTVPSWTDHILLAGFAENRNEEGDRERQGDLVLWDALKLEPMLRLVPAAQCVFDLAWHPRLPLFAAATTPGSLLSSKRTKSVIRTWTPYDSGSRIMEFECPALDINEILFNPLDHNYICAACTNGSAYMWDVRRPDETVQILQHGQGIEEIDEHRPREEQDTGMRFISWSEDGSQLYTGSSDGTVKHWNPFVAQEDCLIQDLAVFDSGVMCGTFSPDYSTLLIGLCKGAVQLLSSAPPTEPSENVSSFTFNQSRRSPGFTSAD